MGWKELPGFAPGRIVDLRLFKENDEACVYLDHEVTVDAALSLPLSLGSDDTLSVWLNGESLLGRGPDSRRGPGSGAGDAGTEAGQEPAAAESVQWDRHLGGLRHAAVSDRCGARLRRQLAAGLSERGVGELRFCRSRLTACCAANATCRRTGLLTRPGKTDGSGDPSYNLVALTAQQSVAQC